MTVWPCRREKHSSPERVHLLDHGIGLSSVRKIIEGHGVISILFLVRNPFLSELQYRCKNCFLRRIQIYLLFTIKGNHLQVFSLSVRDIKGINTSLPEKHPRSARRLSRYARDHRTVGFDGQTHVRRDRRNPSRSSFRSDSLPCFLEAGFTVSCSSTLSAIACTWFRLFPFAIRK